MMLPMPIYFKPLFAFHPASLLPKHHTLLLSFYALPYEQGTAASL